MDTTSASLLDRLRAGRPDAADWRHLHDIYVPFIRGCLQWSPGLAGEADDIVQDVLVVVIRELPRFVRQRDGSFRKWLRAVTVNRAREWRRARRRHPAAADPADEFLAQLADPASELARRWDREHDRHVFARLFAVVRAAVEPTTWEAFRLMTLDGYPAAAVSEKLGISEAAVYQANSRIRRRLREEAAGLTD